MKRVLLTVAYDGTAYHGYAEQEGVPTIEGLLRRALHGLTGERIELIGASRTDSGVHAYGNLAVFDTKSTIPADRFLYPLNRMLPEDIRILYSREVPQDFHPRHCSSVKTYEYRIRNTQIPFPVEKNYLCHNSFPLNVEAMQEAAQALVGEHDFTSFCNVASQAQDHIRRIREIQVVRGEGSSFQPGRCWDDSLVTIRVRGDGFLYNMVRIIAGTLMMVGAGQRRPQDVKGMLEACDRAAAGPTAVAEGLYLIGYEIPEIGYDYKALPIAAEKKSSIDNRDGCNV